MNKTPLMRSLCQRSLIHREAWFPSGPKIPKKTLFFLKNIRHPTLGSGGKKTFTRYLKSEHTDGQTDGQTDRQTDGHTDGHLDL